MAARLAATTRRGTSVGTKTAEANTGRPTVLGLAAACGGDWKSVLMIVKADTVVAWQRKGFRLFWTWKIARSAMRAARGPESDDPSAGDKGFTDFHCSLLNATLGRVHYRLEEYWVTLRRPETMTHDTPQIASLTAFSC
jgi:hypothetical protein